MRRHWIPDVPFIHWVLPSFYISFLFTFLFLLSLTHKTLWHSEFVFSARGGRSQWEPENFFLLFFLFSVDFLFIYLRRLCPKERGKTVQKLSHVRYTQPAAWIPWDMNVMQHLTIDQIIVSFFKKVLRSRIDILTRTTTTYIPKRTRPPASPVRRV